MTRVTLLRVSAARAALTSAARTLRSGQKSLALLGLLGQKEES